MEKSKNIRKDKYPQFYVPTTRRNYLIEIYTALGMALFLNIIPLIKNEPFSGALLIGTFFTAWLTFQVVQYLLTKKTVPLVYGIFQIKKGEDAKRWTISFVLGLIVILFAIIIS